MLLEQHVDDLEDAKHVVEEAMRERGHTPLAADGVPQWRSFGHEDGSVMYSLDCIMCHQWGSVTNVLTMAVPEKCKMYWLGG